MYGFIADNGTGQIEYFGVELNARQYGAYAPCILPEGVELADSYERTGITEILDGMDRGPIHGRYVPVTSPRGRQLVAEENDRIQQSAEQAYRRQFAS